MMKKAVFAIILGLVLASPCLAEELRYPGTLLDRTIRWADGSSEHVQIDSNCYFRLDGRKARLVGIDLGTTGMSKEFYDPASLAIFDKELAYLESAGIRLIHVCFPYPGYKREAERYSGLLDLLYRRKMLVFPLITGKWLPNFGNLTQADFVIGGSDSLGQWATRWCAVMTNYPNVVAVAAENELDIPQKPPAVPARQDYTGAATAAYMKFLTSTIRSPWRGPVVTKLCGEVNASWPWRPDIKEAVLPFSDTPCLDVYYPTVREMDAHLEAVLNWLKEKGFKTNGVWIAEANAGTGNAPRSADFSTAYVESMFDHGAAVVCLWVANRVKNPAWAFFDADGNPGKTLLRMAPDLKRLQAPISESRAVPGTQEQIKQENDMLAKAADAIEKNRKRDATVRVVDKNGRPATGVGLVVELIRHDFLFGGNIYRFDRFGAAHENELYQERFRELFNYATTGFYWKWYEPERGKPDYVYTDKVVAWCEQNHIRLKGHPLLWACESGIPPWAKEQPPAEIRKQRVADIMSRYAGKIEFWEVLNEPAHSPGLEIDAPYRWAREVNSNACLIVNDYQAMADGYPPFFTLLQKALGRGVPFDGVGIQAHEPRTMRFPLEQVWKTLDQYASLGKPLHITEFSPTSGGQEITGSHITGKWDEAAQADYAAKFYTVCFAHPAVAAITWWDLSDAGSWLEGGGLIRKDMSPKPAYAALRKLIREQWATKSEGKTDKDGEFSFRGFCGHYGVRITHNGKIIEQPFHVALQGRNAIKIVLRENASNPPE